MAREMATAIAVHETRGTLPQGTITYNVGFIVLSYVVSLIGCVTTLELLHRRTSRRGAYNWYLLVSSCITMGAVGIWCMHFIGNRAIEMKGPYDLHVIYSPAFTAVSFFLPIVVLFIAFYILGITDRVNRYYITVSGVLAGTAICGMHYVGQLGITNYICYYYTANIVGAAVIAVVASLIALSVFFRLRELWTDCWWKRAMCAAILAGAVSGMHWTATLGTEYAPKGGYATSKAYPLTTIIVSSVLSVLTCCILLFFACLTTRKKHIYRTRSQQLVLACGYFDEEGRVMVTSEGGLPCAKITNHYVEKTFGEDELSRTHPTFVWVFKASRNWPGIKPLISGMRENLDTDPVARKYRPGHTTPTDDAESEAAVDFSAVFKQLFCVAAQTLANSIHEPLENLGVLFEEPLATGTTNMNRRKTSPTPAMRKLSFISSSSEERKDSMGRFVIGRGQYLSVTRQLSPADVEKFAAQGFRFASIPSIAEPMARNMQVSQSWMLGRLERMRKTASAENLLPPGVHLACFMLRPSIHKSFDILVPANMQNQLPVVTLPVMVLRKWHVDMLQKFEGFTISSTLKILINSTDNFELEHGFRWQFYRALSQLVELVGDPPFMMQARFSAKQITAPSRTGTHSVGPATCTLLSVRAMQTIHAVAPKADMTYVPLSFFSAQQQMYSGQESHDKFARQAMLEFAHCLGKGQDPTRAKGLLRTKSWGDIKSKNRFSAPVTPRTPNSLLRTSFQRPNSRRISIDSKQPIVSVEGATEWMEMMERQHHQAMNKAPLSKPIALPDSSDDELRNALPTIPSSPIAVSPSVEHERNSPVQTTRNVRTQEDPVVRVSVAEAKEDSAEHGSFVYELFRLFKF